MSKGFVSRGFLGRRKPGDEDGRIPPGQYLERRFPVLSAGPTPHTPLAFWSPVASLIICGTLWVV